MKVVNFTSPEEGKMFGRKRKQQRLFGDFLNVVIQQATDPRRKAMTEVIEAILLRAGFAQAEIDHSQHTDSLKKGSTGFWTRVDPIGPGIVLVPAGQPTQQAYQKMAGGYLDALNAAFRPILGTQTEQYLRLDTSTKRHSVTVMIPPDAQLKRLHEVLVRKR